MLRDIVKNPLITIQPLINFHLFILMLVIIFLTRPRKQDHSDQRFDTLIVFGHSHWKKTKTLKRYYHLLVAPHGYFIIFPSLFFFAFAFEVVFFSFLLCTSPLHTLDNASCCCAPHLFEFMCCLKLLVALVLLPHLFEFMCCFKLVVVTALTSSLQAPKVIGCYCAFHLLELFLKLLVVDVHLTSFSF